MVLVKICGITRLEDALSALDAGADFLGFNFYSKSPRYLDPKEAFSLFENLPSAIPKVGVFVNENIQKVIDIAIDLALDYLQFHGDENPKDLNILGRPWFKALRLQSEEDLKQVSEFDCEWILLDAYSDADFGGTGKLGDWKLAAKAHEFHKKIILAGGLHPKNVDQAIAQVRPHMVDVASGVEDSPGAKSRIKMQEFIWKAKK